MNNKYPPSSYEYVFGNLSAEEKKQLEMDDIPIPVVLGKAEITDEEKIRAENFLKEIRDKKYDK